MTVTKPDLRGAAAAFALSLVVALGSSGLAYAAVPAFVEARAASGAAAWSKLTSLTAVGVEERSGMKGTWREVADLRQPRLRQSDDAGIVHSLSVLNGKVHWRQRSSGGVHAINSPLGQAIAVTDEWLAQRRYLDPDGGGAAVTAPERRSEGGVDYAVLTATPKGGQAVELWFDAGSHRLVRTSRRMNLNTEVHRFADYRTVAGVALPYLISEGDGGTTIRIGAYTVNAATERDFQKPRAPDDASITGGRTTVPIVFDGSVIVQAKINGQGPFGFILDTGGHDILTPAAVKALGLTAEGAGSSGGAGEGKVSEQYVRIARMDIGGMTMRHQVFTVIPMTYATTEQGPRPPLAGILGMEIFERFAVRLDYRAQRLTLEPLKTYVHRGPGVALPLYFNDDEPIVTASLDGHTGEFGVDTGNGGAMIVQGRWADREGMTARLKSGLDSVGFGMGGMTHSYASRVDVLLAGVPLRHVIGRYQNDKAGAFASIAEAANIGSDILGNFTLDFDYLRGRLWFQPTPGFQTPPFNRSGIGATKERAEAFKVVSVAQDTPAAEAGLQVGDEILRVDGRPAQALSLRDLFRSERGSPGTRLKLDLVRKGAPQSVTVVLRELLP